MELEQLRQLAAVARHGTISAAAEELRISQPALSRSMRRLEDDLGQELFERARNHVELNEAGAIALEHAHAMLRDERALRDAMDELSRRARTIVVGTVAPAPVWRLTARTVERFPGTILSPVTLDDRELERRLFNREIDLAIVKRPITLPTISLTPIMREELYAYVPTSSPLTGEERLTFSQLDGESFLIDASAGFWIGMCRELMPHAQIIEQADRTVLDQLVRTTELISFVTNITMQTVEPIEGRVAIPIEDDEAQVTFYLAAPADAPERVREIVEWVDSHAD